jgi:hypothetical protein
VPLAQKAVVGEPDPALQEGEDGYADWAIVAIYGFHEYLDHTYRRLVECFTRCLELSPDST